MQDLNSKETNSILKHLYNGYFLSIYQDKYSLYQSKETRDLSREGKELLYDTCKKFGIHYFTKMSFKEYSTNNGYAKLIDYILAYLNIHKTSEGFTLVLGCNLSEKIFFFKEVK